MTFCAAGTEQSAVATSLSRTPVAMEPAYSAATSIATAAATEKAAAPAVAPELVIKYQKGELRQNLVLRVQARAYLITRTTQPRAVQ